MQLERVIAALAPKDVIGRAPVEVSDLAYDARVVTPGALFFCVPGARFDGHDFAAEAVARRRERARGRARAPGRWSRSSSSTTRAARWPLPPRSSSATRPRSSRSSASPARTARRRRPTSCTRSSPRPGRRPGLLGTVETRRRRRAARSHPDDCRGDRPPADVPRDARRGQPQLRDGGRRRTVPSFTGSTACASPRSSSRT